MTTQWPRGRLVAHPEPGKVWVQVQHRDDIASDWIEADELPVDEDRLREVERRVRALATAGDPVTHETVRQVVLTIIRDVAGAPYCSPKRRAEGWRCSAPCADQECAAPRYELAADEAIRQAHWEDAVIEGKPWAGMGGES